MKLLIWGCNGCMGEMVAKTAKNDPFFTEVDGIDLGIKISSNPSFDVIIDFSHPSSIYELLSFATTYRIPSVIATTGHNEEENGLIKKASRVIGILQSTNMSLGMNLVFSLVEQTAKFLKEQVDIEIIEAHHNRKKDAPSGSAKTMVDLIEKGLGHRVPKKFGREGQCPRIAGEIGIHSIRSGNTAGFHEAIFANHLESIKISHEVHNRLAFAQGALEAAKYIIGKKRGYFTMKDLLGLELKDFLERPVASSY